MQIALLVDNSQAADPYIRDIRDAAPPSSGRSGTTDGSEKPVAVITIGERPTINTDTPTSSGYEGRAADLRHTGSGNYLLDALIETARDSRSAEPHVR